MRSVQDRLLSILYPFQGEKYEKIAKQTKQYEKTKFRVFNNIARNCLILNKSEKEGDHESLLPICSVTRVFTGEHQKIFGLTELLIV